MLRFSQGCPYRATDTQQVACLDYTELLHRIVALGIRRAKAGVSVG
jgi:hypothetical protein